MPTFVAGVSSLLLFVLEDRALSSSIKNDPQGLMTASNSAPNFTSKEVHTR